MTGPEPRTSIWSIPESRRTLYFGLFTLLALAGMGWVFWYEIAYQSGDNWAGTVQAIIQGIPTAGAAAAVATISAIESRRIIVVVGDWLEERIRKNREKDIEKARQTGRDEGRTEAQKTQEERVRRLVESGQLPREALELLVGDESEEGT